MCIRDRPHHSRRDPRAAIDFDLFAQGARLSVDDQLHTIFLASLHFYADSQTMLSRRQRNLDARLLAVHLEKDHRSIGGEGSSRLIARDPLVISKCAGVNVDAMAARHVTVSYTHLTLPTSDLV